MITKKVIDSLINADYDILHITTLLENGMRLSRTGKIESYDDEVIVLIPGELKIDKDTRVMEFTEVAMNVDEVLFKSRAIVPYNTILEIVKLIKVTHDSKEKETDTKVQKTE